MENFKTLQGKLISNEFHGMRSFQFYRFLTFLQLYLFSDALTDGKSFLYFA